MLKAKFSAWFAGLMIFAMALGACAPAATPTTQPTQAPASTAVPVNTIAPGDTAVPKATVTAAPQSQVTLPDVDPAKFRGNIIVAGSSTVFPLTERMAEIFNDDGFTGNITIDSIGTGAGFERFCKSGESDISNASRAIRASEIESCQAIGREPIEFRVGTDALAIVVSTDNDFLDAVTKEELAKIYSSDAVAWSDVNPAWPAERILRFSPGTDSGTFDYFIEAVMTPALDITTTADVNEGETSLLDAEGLQLSEETTFWCRACPAVSMPSATLATPTTRRTPRTCAFSALTRRRATAALSRARTRSGQARISHSRARYSST